MTADASELTMDVLLAARRHLYDESTPPPVRAIKVGRRELAYVRQLPTAPAVASYRSILGASGDHLHGVPCYEVDKESHIETLRGDSRPDTDALNRWLMSDPPAKWGPVG